MYYIMLTEEKWQAIIESNASYNGQFFYAVKTTKIFCKPSCKSRVPNKANVHIFKEAEDAIRANYRPCKRCKPTHERLPDHEWISNIAEYIEMNYIESLTLDKLAEMNHGSPYHLHRTFKKVKGMTPVEYIHEVRIKTAKKLLGETKHTISDIGQRVGIPNTSYFITLFKKIIGCTPAKYRQSGEF
jgi:AraC family transcriptional regulator, regulatory protein of adaptative response / methylphosphotriester-DNA alkyltransferase methyltransferase